MRIMIDTNVLVSGLLFPDSQVNTVLLHIMSKHRLVVPSYVLDEFKDVIRRKFPKQAEQIDDLLKKLSYELAYTPDKMRKDLFAIRDIADYPVLYAAMIEGVDVLLTGDKDFAAVRVDMPKIMTPRKFLDSEQW